MSQVDFNSLSVLFQKANFQHLLNNQQSIDRWEKYKAENEQVKKNLETFIEKLSVSVMVPVGNKALFRGKLVHTNDVLMSIGDGYFIKGSVKHALEVISRRLQASNEMLQKLQRERKLIESRTQLPSNYEIFPQQGQTEIFEECKEDEYEAWKEEHRKKVRESRQKLAEIKSQQPASIQTEEDLFKHLDLLEMQEELEDEMAKLGISDDDSSNEESGSAEEDSEVDDDDSSSSSEGSETGFPVRPAGGDSQNVVRKAISSSGVLNGRASINSSELLNMDVEKSNDDCIRINFKHSSSRPDITLCEDTIVSPHDIYIKYSTALKKKVKMVKRVSFAEPNVTGFAEPEEGIRDSSPKIESSIVSEEYVPVLGDVMERTAAHKNDSVVNRPLSKFKSSRKK